MNKGRCNEVADQSNALRQPWNKQELYQSHRERLACTENPARAPYLTLTHCIRLRPGASCQNCRSCKPSFAPRSSSSVHRRGVLASLPCPGRRSGFSRSSLARFAWGMRKPKPNKPHTDTKMGVEHGAYGREGKIGTCSVMNFDYLAEPDA